ncbi:MAG: hypothetical protein GY811_18710 [Myxococcales bacterium]|nr:hypothetical protein [Myxococcales bacterium]
MRSRTLVVGLALAPLAGTACGSSEHSIASAGEDPVPASRAADHEKVIIVSRTAPVPESTLKDERLIFVKAGSVWMMGPDGADPEQLTVRSLDAADEAPAVSPNGQHLIYSSPKEGPLNLYIQSIDDMIPSSLGEGRDAAWSPDGRQIAFMRGDEGVGLDLYTLDLDGESDPKLILKGDDDHPEISGKPAWNADGSAIFLSADRRLHQGSTLWKVDVATSSLSRLSPASTDASWTSDSSPALSPDGKTLAFTSNRHGSSSDDAADFDVYSIQTDGSKLIRLTDDSGTVATPAYSRDGSRLYFASTRTRTADYEWEIFVMAATGGEQKRLTREARPENSAPSLAILTGLSQ